MKIVIEVEVPNNSLRRVIETAATKRKRLRLDEAAQMLMLGGRRASRTWKKSMGSDFRQTVTKLRMDAAASLLKAGWTIKDVMARFDYATESGFSRAFQRQKGVRPGRYRKSERADMDMI